VHHLLANRVCSQEQLPHVLEGAEWGSYQTREKLRLYAFLALDGGFVMLDRQIVVGIGESEAAPLRTPVPVCMKGQSLLGFFHLCWGAAAFAASVPRYNEVPGASFNDMARNISHDNSPCDQRIHFSYSECVVWGEVLAITSIALR
jgi:hypothetical protein